MARPAQLLRAEAIVILVMIKQLSELHLGF